MTTRSGKSGAHRYVSDPELIELIRQLAREFSDVQIARILHRKRLRTPKGLTFTTCRIAGLRNNYGIPPAPKLPRKGEDIHTALEAGKILSVDRGTVIRWVEAGLLRGLAGNRRSSLAYPRHREGPTASRCHTRRRGMATPSCPKT